ncbi:probable transport portein [Alloactinosynnema sp. L-07]|uniref:MFS transporter n=1 Tax=Alloactinosynnema sp. L-07 TaxID=1653480 RepID=UPI00065EF764|nr:MFS transporter [Alloactinosynnema sp. L-07]CRK57532.1 probable transport portein [Alloactinosynnema sp. L-07]
MTEATVTPERQDRWGLVAVAGILSFVAMLDMSIVTVALAKIGDELQVSPQAAQWAVLGYQLVVVALLLPVGGWLDGAGPRSAVLASVTVFACASGLAALSPNLTWLIAARVVQGTAAAVLFVLMPVLAAKSVRPEMRGRAMSVPATLGPLGAVLGPAIGGVLLDQWGWQSIFLVKIPFCLVGLLVAWRIAPRGGGLPAPSRAAFVDAGLIGSAVAAVLLALTFAVDSPAWLLLALVAVPATAAWLRRDSGKRVAGTIAGGLWRVDSAVLCLAAAFAAMHYLVALHLQRDEGVSATSTGLTVIAFPLAMALAGPIGGRLADRFGHRPVAISGAATTTLGLLLLVFAGAEWTPVDIAWRMAIAGLGMGLYGGPSQVMAMATAPDRMGAASSAVQVARSLGFTVGPALATAAWAMPGGSTPAGLILAMGAGALGLILLTSTRSGR